MGVVAGAVICLLGTVGVGYFQLDWGGSDFWRWFPVSVIAVGLGILLIFASLLTGFVGGLVVRRHPRLMRILRRLAKVTLAVLAFVALGLGIGATQLHVVELDGPAYEGYHWGLRPSEMGDLALVGRHFTVNSLRRGDLALFDLHYVNEYGPAVERVVRVVEQPPDGRTGQFSWIEYYHDTLEPSVEETASSNVVFRGRVVCLIRLPWAWFR